MTTAAFTNKLLSMAGGTTGQAELEECIEVILQVIKAVNDSLQQGNIRGLPEVLYPLGGLVCQEVFSVHIENKQQASHIFKSRKQTRQVLLFDTQLVFCKVNSKLLATQGKINFNKQQNSRARTFLMEKFFISHIMLTCINFYLDLVLELNCQHL